MRDYATLGPGPVGSYEVVGMGGGCGVGRGGGGAAVLGIRSFAIHSFANRSFAIRSFAKNYSF